MAPPTSDEVRVALSADGRFCVFIPAAPAATLGLTPGARPRCRVRIEDGIATLTPIAEGGVVVAFTQRGDARVVVRVAPARRYIGGQIATLAPDWEIVDGSLVITLPATVIAACAASREARDAAGPPAPAPDPTALRDIARVWNGVDFAPHNLTLRRS